LRLIAGSGRADAILKIGRLEHFLGLESILADNIRNLNLGAAQGQVDSRRNSEEKDDSNRNHDCDAAENRYDSCR
jgi:hypothetical protein